MYKEGCGDFEVKKGNNICNHFIGDVKNKQQVKSCFLNCSLRLIAEKSEIDTKRCTE